MPPSSSKGLAVFWDGVNSGKMRVVRHYIEKGGASVNIRDEGGRTPLHYAGISGLMELAKYLLEERGADIHAVSNLGMTSLHYAARFDHLALCEYLVKKGCSVSVEDSDGRTPLHLAARFGHPTICRWLLEEGMADADICDDAGNRPDDKEALSWIADDIDREDMRLVFMEARRKREEELSVLQGKI